MCTAVTYKTGDFYFGRTLDWEFLYPCEVVITPRRFPFEFKNTELMSEHFAITGMAYVCEDYPLYFDAFNERGLGMAGLNFMGNAVYGKKQKGRVNVAQFELIPYILGKCSSVKEVKLLCENLNITDTSFSAELPPSPLHWLVADSESAVTIEAVKEGLKVYDNPVGVLTNNPPFPMQMFSLSNYMSLSTLPVNNNFSDKISLNEYSRGMGAIGLPGDYSSGSRFVRASFVKLNSVSSECEGDSISQFFHILGSVLQPRGCCKLGENEWEYTQYSSCMNVTKGIYYYTTYKNTGIVGVDMYREELGLQDLIRVPLVTKTKINIVN